MYSLPEKKHILKGLLQLSTSGPVRSTLGVCANLNILIESLDLNGYDVVTQFAWDWPKALRDDAGKLYDYFVPDTPDSYLWEDTNLELRNELLDFLIDKLEDSILNHVGD